MFMSLLNTTSFPKTYAQLLQSTEDTMQRLHPVTILMFISLFLPEQSEQMASAKGKTVSMTKNCIWISGENSGRMCRAEPMSAIKWIFVSVTKVSQHRGSETVSRRSILAVLIGRGNNGENAPLPVIESAKSRSETVRRKHEDGKWNGLVKRIRN